MNRKLAEEHIIKLAKTHRLLINWRKISWMRSECHRLTRQIFIPRPTTLLRYFAALHEIGHLVNRHATAAWWRDHGLTDEGAAWEWAFDHALPELLGELTAHDRRQIGLAWASHLPVR